MTETETPKVAAHTPGPWHIGRADQGWAERTCLSIIAEGPGPNSKSHGMIRLAEVFAGNFVDREANARLIAAAPDLLAALKALVDTSDRAPLELRMARGRLAIAKAEGRTEP